uniref:RING-type domain-containing protein n=1 Tax=Strigamia maritima TaxID=126957 RepID=T1JDT2_STRMM
MVRVAVIGCGLLGVNIAGELAYHGHYVKIHDNESSALDKVPERLKYEKKMLETDGISFDFSGPVYCLGKLEETVKDVDFIFEAVTDNLEVKKYIFELQEFLQRMGKTIFFRSGPTPLILSESQREERKCARLERIRLNKRLGGRTKYFVPELAHLGNFAPDRDDLSLTYTNRSNADNECAVCMDHIRDCVFNPCHHLSTCVKCGHLLLSRGEGCPICRKDIVEIIRIFHP